jgi:hypothetical protein
MRITAEKQRFEWRIAIIAILLLYCTFTLIISLSSTPGYFQRVVTSTVPVVRLGDTVQISNETIAANAAVRGMSLPFFAGYNIFLNLIITLGFVFMAALILIKSPREWFSWYTALVLLFYPQGALYTFSRVAPVLTGHVLLLGSLLWPLFGLFLFLFPNGKAVPRWMIWPFVVYFVLHFAVQAAALAIQIGLLPGGLTRFVTTYGAIVLLVFPMTLFAQIYRYRKVSNAVERAQTRWFVFGLGSYVIVSIVFSTAGNPASLIGDIGYPGDLTNLISLFIPVSIGIAILRYRLWDIDLIIRPTLVYSMITASLGLVYFGSVVALQAAFRLVSGSGSTLALVMSTLVIAALFNPLRSRLQERIDYRFYRRKYDTTRALDQFGQMTRYETDLERLTTNLVEVIQDTMQPESVALWMKKRK